MAYHVSESLANFGFNPQEKVTSADAFKKQLESYALHVVEDLPVSNRYSYYIGRDGKIFIDSNFQTELYIDLEERDGLAYEGTTKAVNQALSSENLGKVVVLYSPPGPVTFRSGTKYDKVKPYSSGQLYLMVGNADNKVDCLAITVGEENENGILDIFFEGKSPRDFDNVESKITYYLTTPRPLSKNIDELIDNLLSYDPNIVVYTNVHGRVFNLGQVIQMMILGWDGIIKPKISFDDVFSRNVLSSNLTKNLSSANILRIYGQDVSFFYHRILEAYTGVYGNSYSLGGGCGGMVYSKGEKTLFERWSVDNTNPLSTSWRKLISEDSNRYDDYECPSCHQKIQGELKNRPETWHTNCPHCGHPFNCKNGENNFSVN